MNAPRFRPPAEAGSLLLQIDEGCPHNTCAFCGMYKDLRHRARPMDEIDRMIREAARRFPGTRRVFLADGDVMQRPAAELQAVLERLAGSFPRLTRVNLYANGSSIEAKTDAQLTALRRLRLHTLYMGLESGDPDVLKSQGKTETPERMIHAAQRAQSAGLRMSVMVLLGLGGADGSAGHARCTAAALNEMQPRLLSVLRLIPLPGTPLAAKIARGRFPVASEYDILTELRALLAGLHLTGTVFRADHSSNIVPLQGRLPGDKRAFMNILDTLISREGLDRHHPAPAPLWL